MSNKLTYKELSSANYSVIIEGKQLTYLVEKDGNSLRINANPLYEFLKEMFTTEWQTKVKE